MQCGLGERSLEQYHIASLKPGPDDQQTLKGAEFQAAGNREGGSKWHTHLKGTTIAQTPPIFAMEEKLPLRIAGSSDFVVVVVVFNKSS